MTKEQIQDEINLDEVTKSKGVFTVREGFFYRNGKTAQDLVTKVLNTFPEADVVDYGEIFKHFDGGSSVRNSSHWFVKFQM